MRRNAAEESGIESGESSAWGIALWVPPADVVRTDEEVIVRVELAGATPGDVRVGASETELIVAGHRREPPGPPVRRIDRMEIAFGPFERAIPLPVPVRPEAATARLADGLLEVVLPLADPPQPRSGSRGAVVVAIVLSGR
jgi:HSP20 family protein